MIPLFRFERWLKKVKVEMLKKGKVKCERKSGQFSLAIYRNLGGPIRP